MRRLLSVARVAGRNDKWLVRQLRAPDVYFSWRLDAKTYAIAVHRDHGDDDQRDPGGRTAVRSGRQGGQGGQPGHGEGREDTPSRRHLRSCRAPGAARAGQPSCARTIGCHLVTFPKT